MVPMRTYVFLLVCLTWVSPNFEKPLETLGTWKFVTFDQVLCKSKLNLLCAKSKLVIIRPNFDLVSAVQSSDKPICYLSILYVFPYFFDGCGIDAD